MRGIWAALALALLCTACAPTPCAGHRHICTQQVE